LSRFNVPQGWLLLLTIVFACCQGCGESYPSGTLEGQVTVDGQPLELGTIHFTPMDGGGAPTIEAQIGSDGRYRAERVSVGRNRAVFHAIKETGKMLRDRDMNIDYAETKSLIAPKFHLEGIEIDVVSGTTAQDFQLTSK
jgi:hypothetical protein